MGDKERMRKIHDTMPPDWDKGPISLVHEMREMLRAVADEGTPLDSGTSSGQGDLWATVGGIEYFITVRRSNRQIALDNAAAKEN